MRRLAGRECVRIVLAGLGVLAVAACTVSAPPRTDKPQPIDPSGDNDDEGADKPWNIPEYDAGPSIGSAHDAGPAHIDDAHVDDAPASDDTDVRDAAPARDAGPPPDAGPIALSRDARLTGIWTPRRPSATTASWFKRFEADGLFSEHIDDDDWSGSWSQGDRANHIVVDTYLVGIPDPTRFREFCVYAMGPAGADLDIFCDQEGYPADNAVLATATLPGFWARK